METPLQPRNPPTSLVRELVAWGSVPTVDDVDRIAALAEPIIKCRRSKLAASRKVGCDGGVGMVHH